METLTVRRSMASLTGEDYGKPNHEEWSDTKYLVVSQAQHPSEGRQAWPLHRKPLFVLIGTMRWPTYGSVLPHCLV